MSRSQHEAIEFRNMRSQFRRQTRLILVNDCERMQKLRLRGAYALCLPFTAISSSMLNSFDFSLTAMSSITITAFSLICSLALTTLLYLFMCLKLSTMLFRTVMSLNLFSLSTDSKPAPVSLNTKTMSHKSFFCS